MKNDALLSEFYRHMFNSSTLSYMRNLEVKRREVEKSYKEYDGGGTAFITILYSPSTYKLSVMITRNPVETETLTDRFFRHCSTRFLPLKAEVNLYYIAAMSGCMASDRLFRDYGNSNKLYASFNGTIDSGNCGAILLKDLSIHEGGKWVNAAIADAIELCASEWNKPLVLMSDRVGGNISYFTQSQSFKDKFGEYRIGAGLKNPNSGNDIFSISFAVKSIRPLKDIKKIYFEEGVEEDADNFI